jgi:hypothetical protein
MRKQTAIRLGEQKPELAVREIRNSKSEWSVATPTVHSFFIKNGQKSKYWRGAHGQPS